MLGVQFEQLAGNLTVKPQDTAVVENGRFDSTVETTPRSQHLVHALFFVKIPDTPGQGMYRLPLG